MSLKRNFASRVSLFVMVLSALIMLAVTLSLGFISKRTIKKDARERAEMMRMNATLEIEKVITEVERAVDNLDWVVVEKRNDEKFLYEVTRELVEVNPNIIGSAVAFEPGAFKGREYIAPYTYLGDVSGEIRSIQMGNDSYDYPSLDWYQIPKLLDRPYWSEPYYDEGGGEQRMSTYSWPLKDEDGNFFGILTADISLEWLSKLLGSIQLYELPGRSSKKWEEVGSYMMMIGRNGTFIAHPDSSKVLNETIFTSALAIADSTAMLIAKSMISGENGTVEFDNGGMESFAVYGPLSNGWSLALICPYNQVFSRVRAFNIVMILVLIAGLMLLMNVTRKVISRLMLPVVEFSNSAITMAKGNFKARIPEVNSRDELFTLRNSLAYMQRSINEYISEIKITTASNERYESELNIAREIQMSMLPVDFPKREDFDLHAMVQPAKEVGGDLYDFMVVENSVFFLVGDVSGKGVPAALFMAITRAAFRFIGALGLPIEEVMSRVNNCLCDGNSNNMFVTIFAGRIDLLTGDVEYCNAGHNPIVVVTPDGKASFLRARPNLAAGLFENFPYQGEKMHLEPGSRLVLYTDGVTEAEREDKQQYGDDRLLGWAGGLITQTSAKSATLDLYASVKHFVLGAPQNDDITIMSLVFNGNHKQ
ncbi:MAG: SpoIIE family protein phosphatase [Bacteroidales bacterium]|nr:SpoIIE family protein phosphatase [Bacteroidales bacterium]